MILLILIFIHWRKGPKIWQKNAPKIYLGLLIIVYIIFPTVNVILTLVYWFQGMYDDVTVGVFFFFAGFLIKPLELYFFIWKTVVYEARYYLKIKA